LTKLAVFTTPGSQLVVSEGPLSTDFVTVKFVEK
jgi:hypothetical protein